jgi:hypothetical protein
MKTLNRIARQADITEPKATGHILRALRLACCTALVLSALSVRAGAQPQAPFWADNGCLYELKGRNYVTELCRRLVGPHTFEYWNPVRREWLMRLEDNPANLYMDLTLLQGPMAGWTARLGVARPNQNAVRAGIWSIRNPQGVWTNVPTQGGDTPAGQAARNLGTMINDRSNSRGVGIVLGGIPVIR